MEIEQSEENSSVIELDLNNLCRICGLTSKILIPIFDKGSNELSRKIESYLPIKVNDSDICSKLCIHCTNALLMWDEIYENCIETDKKLKEIFQMTPFKSRGSDVEEEDSENERLEIDLDKMDEPENVEKDQQPEPLSPPPREEGEDEENSSRDMAKDSNQNTLKCIYCDATTTLATIKNQRDLNEHYRIEHFETVFHCEMCDNYLDRGDLMPHMIQHALEAQTSSTEPPPPIVSSVPAPPLESSEQQIATTIPSKENGKTTVTNGKENQLYCQVCQKHFSTHNGFSYHINQVHSKIKNYSCTYCDKKFGMKRILDNHIRNIHSDEKNFQCLKCLKYFKTDAALYNHEIIHKQSNFECDFCKKKFHYKHNLEVHRLLHSEERKYSCDHCSSTFKTRNYLSKHLKSHFTNMKDFLCSFCEFKTTQKRYLAEHVKRKHSGSNGRN